MRTTKTLSFLFTLLLAMCTLSASAQGDVLNATFDDLNGKGGNDGTWGGVISSMPKEPYTSQGWKFSHPKAGKQCVILGTAQKKGKLTTPELHNLKGNANVTFRAGAWKGDATQITLSVVGGGSISPNTIEITKENFKDCTATITGGSSTTRLVIESQKDAKNRFFIDDIVISNVGTTPPPNVPALTEVSSLSGLRALTTPTEVRLTLSEEKAPVVNAVKEGDVYVSNNEGAVVFRNFLTNDKGWNPTKGGKLVGTIVARYEWKDGMPTLVATERSSAHAILCPAGQTPPYLNTATLSECVSKVEHRGTAVQFDQAQVKTKEGKLYLHTTQVEEIAVADLFSTLAELGTPEEIAGRNYQITAIVGGTDDTHTQLIPLEATEMTYKLSLDETKDNLAQLQANEGRLVDISIQRGLVAGMWNALTLPFSLTNEDIEELLHAQVAQFESYDSQTRTLKLARTDEMKAGEPYLVLPTENMTTINVQGVRLTATLNNVEKNGVTFKGFYAPETLTANDKTAIFIGRNNLLHYPNTTASLKAFRAYFRMPQGSLLAPKRISIDGISSTLTVIENIQVTEEETVAPIYTLSGQRITLPYEQLTPGVYLSKGKKIVIR